MSTDRPIGGILLALTMVFSARPTAQAEELSKIPAMKIEQLVSKPHIDYPYEAKRAGMHGTGTVVIEINPETGGVIGTRMGKSTGFALLDLASTQAFQTARFAKGTPKLVKMPVTFKLRP